MAEEKLTTSPLKRMMKISGMVGRVSASVLYEKIISSFRSEMGQKSNKLKNLAKNAQRIVETLGKLKGAAMKVGQMLSLYEGLLPSTVSEILSKLQKEAPSVPFEVMHEEVKAALKENYKIFKSISSKPYASASIGQVHRGELVDGRQVAVKIQYPAIDHIIKSDLKNLKTLLTTLFSLFTNIDPEPIWMELKERLLEELDYNLEAKNLSHMGMLHFDIPEIIIPKVVEEATCRQVLTMEFVEGISPQQACLDTYDQDLRNQWGRSLWEYTLRGIFIHQHLHADPNFANFAFRADGKVIIYDFGCMKVVPKILSKGYSRIIISILEGNLQKIPGILKEMGVYKKDGQLIPQEVIDEYAKFFQIVFRKSPPYTFGKDQEFYADLFKLVSGNWEETSDLKFPRDVVFIDRTMSGHFGNLSKLKACSPWGKIIYEHAKKCLEKAD